jgi:hypothetical protein
MLSQQLLLCSRGREILNITILLLSVDRTKLVRFGVYILDMRERGVAGPQACRSIGRAGSAQAA